MILSLWRIDIWLTPKETDAKRYLYKQVICEV